jgi:PAS domain S-box-containing protein
MIITGWKVFTVKSSWRYYMLLMGISYLIASIIPSFANVLSRDGIIERGTFQVLWDIFSLVGMYILVIFYLNYTQDRVPIMAKVVSIILLTTLLILQGFSYYSFQDNEKAYDTIHQSYTELAISDKSQLRDISYITVYSIADGSFVRKYWNNNNIFNIDFSRFENEYLNAAMHEKINSLDDKEFQEELDALLQGTHPGFNGYKNAISQFTRSFQENKKSQKAELLEYLKDIQGSLHYHYSKIQELPNERFRHSVTEYLKKTGASFIPFKAAIDNYISNCKDDGFKLKDGVLSFIAPIGAPEQRHYHSHGTDQFISFLQVDSQTDSVYEVGFLYTNYRAYLHPSAMKFIYALFIIFGVIVFGFNLFLRGILIIPLHRLVDGLRDISKGKFDVQIPVKLGDEIGFVSSNFNQMAIQISQTNARLDEYTATLEQKVEERTRDLAKSEERYRNILENIQDGYYEVDLKGKITFTNDAMSRIMGHTQEDMLRHSYRDFTDKNNADIILNIFNKVHESGKPSEAFDYHIIQKDGSVRITEAVASLITDHDGNKIGFRGIIRDISERRRAEEALRISEEKYRSILETMDEAYFESNLIGFMTFCNDATCRILGYTREELFRMNFREYHSKQTIDKLLEIYKRIFRGEIIKEILEYEVVRKDGTTCTTEMSINLIRDLKGKPTGFRGLGRDITERKKAEEALRESEEKYRTVLDAGIIGYYETDLQGNFIFTNKSFLAYIGYTAEELYGMNFRDFVTEEYAKKILEVFGNVYFGKTTVGIITMQAKRKDGQIVYGESFISARKNSGGTVIGFRCVGIDSTNRKKTEDALLESEEKYRAFVENATDGIFRNDLKGNFLYVNPSGQELLGYSGEELLKMNYRDVVTEEYRNSVLEHYRIQMKDLKEETYIEFPVVRKDGSTIWLGQKTKLKKLDENLYEFNGISRDVTERKKAEEIRFELEEQKTRFFANISHEIRTPLTLMISPIESVIQGDYGKKVNRSFFENLYRNGLRLLKLVNNLLDFSKIEAGRMKMKVGEVDLVVFVRSYIGAVHSAAEVKGLAIAFTSDIPSIPIYFDLEKMDKIIMNLFSNSLKFTENGGTISVNIRSNDDHCYIEFRDTGEGIPAQSINSIFDRFSQADSSATRKHEGTGIGLALVKELVEMHGGTISVESRYIEDSPDDHGSLFTVKLLKGKKHLESLDYVEFVSENDLTESVSDHRFYGMRKMHDLGGGRKTEEKSPEKEIKEEVKTDTLQPENTAPVPYARVLIVDDNRDMRDFLSYLLQKQYEVHWAENGQAGLEAVKKISPDIIITDVMMPVMDGHELTRRLKNDSLYKHIPIIMLTAKAEIAHKLEGFEQGADDFLTKPFNSKELIARIKTLLKTKEYEKEITRRNYEIEQEMEVARLLQRRLLPEQITEISGYKFHALYIPMDKVGGDFYDYTIRDQFIDLFIADVSGHGLPGAFLAMMTKMSLESVTERQMTNRTLYLINDIICRSTVNSNYVTAFLCRIDTHNNIMKFSNAGHQPPLVYREKTGEFFELAAKGKPLGWFSSLNIEEKEFQLLSGDRLILYTDGITECARIQRELFGDDRFREFIIANRAISPEDFCSSLLKHLRDFSQSEKFDDDLTLVVFDVL